MQSDYAWIAAMRTVPVKAEPAAHQSAEANHFHPIAAGARAWGDAQPMIASHTHYDPHGSESESLTACGPSAAFADTGAPEVDSAAGAAVAASPLSPAAWPFVQRERSGTPVLHPVPRRFSRKNRHPQRAREAVAEEWDYYEAPAVQAPPPPKIAALKRKAASEIDSDGVAPPRTKAHTASFAAHAEPKFNRHGAHVCAQCGTSKTPMWRRFSNITYCNACGLRKQRSTGGR